MLINRHTFIDVAFPGAPFGKILCHASSTASQVLTRGLQTRLSGATAIFDLKSKKGGEPDYLKNTAAKKEVNGLCGFIFKPDKHLIL